MGRTLFDKLWDMHVVADLGNGASLLHVDRHLVHDLGGPRGIEEAYERARARAHLGGPRPQHLEQAGAGR
jgi:3-isopropylmalate/(R)-2-methylmalate dehydratase large subunit